MLVWGHREHHIVSEVCLEARAEPSRGISPWDEVGSAKTRAKATSGLVFTLYPAHGAYRAPQYLLGHLLSISALCQAWLWLWLHTDRT